MKKFWFILIFVVIFVGVSYLRNADTPEIKIIETSPVQSPPILPSLKAVSTPFEEKHVETNDQIEKIIPKTEDLRAEVQADPHETPKSLIRFSLDLSQKMDVALKSLEASRSLINELQTCASETSTPESAAAICIKNAYELSGKYGDLKPQADAVRSHAGLKAQKIYDQMKTMGL